MSALTKIFVILLVVLSMLLTAATVVFVNRVEDYKKAADNTKAEMTAARLRAEEAVNQAESARTQAQNQLRHAQTQIETLQGQLQAARQEASKHLVTIADLSSKLSLQSSDVTRLTEALKASEDQKSQLLGQITSLRDSSDKLVKEKAELNMTVSDLTNKLEVTERERKYFQEQYSEAQQQVARFGAAMKDAGMQPEAVAATAGLRGGAPAINGVVRSVKNIANLPYATISVGSADSVAKGMEFKVIDREKGDFLGVLTVDTVEPNEASGRLRGPRVNEVRPGVEVRTQL